MNLKFEFRILDESGDEIASDFTTFGAQQIDEFGGCEAVDIHTGSALRFVRRLVKKTTEAA